MDSKHSAVPTVSDVRRFIKSRKALVAAVVLVFAGVGLFLLTSSRAATYVAAIEAESGTLSGNSSKLTDSSASGSQSVRFGGTTPTPTPPPPTPSPNQPGTVANGPLKISDNGRYLVDQTGRPFLYAADTCWSCLSRLSVADAKRHIDTRKAQGFNAIQTNVIAWNRSDSGPRGQAFTGGNITQPNASFFAGTDEIIQYAASQNMLIVMGSLWTRDNQGAVNTSNGTTYGTFLGNRYKSYKNVVYFVGGDDSETQDLEPNKAIGRAIKAANPAALVTYHMWGGAKPYSNGLKSEAFYSFYSFQWNGNSPPYTYQSVAEGRGQTPVKPFLNIEPPYDPNACCGSDLNTTPQKNRRSGWWTVLAGAMGLVYGGPSGAWNFGAQGTDWNALNRSQASQSGHVRKIMEPLPWEKIIPDNNNSVVTGGRGSNGGTDYVTAGRASDGSMIAAYTPSSRTLTVNLAQLSGPGTARWYDPVSGNPVGTAQNINNSGSTNFSTPGNNAGGDSDWVLILKTN
jgi:hypothetical protein